MLEVASPYPEFFWTCRVNDRDFNKSIVERTVRQSDRQNTFRLYLAAFRCQTTKQSYKIIS